MKVTTTIDLSNKRFAGVKKHVEHDAKIDHSNEYLNTTESQQKRPLNRHRSLADVDKTLERYYGGDVLKANNDKQRKNRHSDRIYENGVDYAKASGSWDKRMVATFGSKEAKEEMIQSVMDSYPAFTPKTAERAVLRSISKGLLSYANGFNRRNSAMTMTYAETNVDEDGAPHVHSQIICHGHTASGKISNTIDNATQEMGFGGNSRERLSKWRDREDKALIKLVSKQLRQDFPDVNNFKRFDLWRKGEHNGLSMEQYQAKKDAESLASSAARAASAVDSRKASLSAVRSELSSASASVSATSSAVFQASNAVLRSASSASYEASTNEDYRSFINSSNSATMAELESSATSLKNKEHSLASSEIAQSAFIDSVASDTSFLFDLNGDKFKKFKARSREFAQGKRHLKFKSGEKYSGLQLVWKLFEIAVKKGGQAILDAYKEYKTEQHQKPAESKNKAEKDDEREL